jgi:hypothetical protein
MAKSKIQENVCGDWPPNTQFYSLYGGYPLINKIYNSKTSSPSAFEALKAYASDENSPLSDASSANINKVFNDDSIIYLSKPAGQIKDNLLIQNKVKLLETFTGSKVRVTSTTNVGNPAPNDFIEYKPIGSKKPIRYRTLKAISAAQKLNTSYIVSLPDNEESDLTLDGDIKFGTYMRDIINGKIILPQDVATEILAEPLGSNIYITYNIYLRITVNIKIIPTCIQPNGDKTVYRVVSVPLNESENNFYFLKIDSVKIKYKLNSNDIGYSFIVEDKKYVPKPGSALGSELQEIYIINNLNDSTKVFGINPEKFDLITEDFTEIDGETKVDIRDPLHATISSDMGSKVQSTINSKINERIDQLFNNPNKSLGEQLKGLPGGLPKDTATDCITGCISDIEIDKDSLEYKICCSTYDTELAFGLPESELKEYIIDLTTSEEE